MRLCGDVTENNEMSNEKQQNVPHFLKKFNLSRNMRNSIINGKKIKHYIL